MPAVLERVTEAMASACENVGVGVRVDPLVAALAHEDLQAQSSGCSSTDSSTNDISSSSDADACVAAGTMDSPSGRTATANKLSVGISQSRIATRGRSRLRPPDPPVGRQAAQGQPILLPPPSRGLLLKDPVLPDRSQFFGQVSPEVGHPCLDCDVFGVIGRCGCLDLEQDSHAC